MQFIVFVCPFSVYLFICLFIYCILAAYTQRCPTNVNMKHRILSNFGMVGPLIRFWQPKQLPLGVANIKTHTHTLPHTHVVSNSH